MDYAQPGRHRSDDGGCADAESYRRDALSTRAGARRLLGLKRAKAAATLLCARSDFPVDLQTATGEGSKSRNGITNRRREDNFQFRAEVGKANDKRRPDRTAARCSRPGNLP